MLGFHQRIGSWSLCWVAPAEGDNYVCINECVKFVGSWIYETHATKFYKKNFYLIEKVVEEVFMLKVGEKLNHFHLYYW